nr:hypothetical protein [Tanacetum cinerariifolium]
MVKEVNKIRIERIAKSANPITLVATAQRYPDNFYQAPNLNDRMHQHQNHLSPQDQMLLPDIKAKRSPNQLHLHMSHDLMKTVILNKLRKTKKCRRIWLLFFKKLYKHTNNKLRTSSDSRNKIVDNLPWKPKRVKDYSYHKEKMLLCKQAKKGVPLQAEQVDWLEDTDEEIDEQELEARYSFISKIREVLPINSSSKDTPLEPTELKKYIAFNDQTVDYDILQSMLNETLGLLARKDIDIKEALKLKAYEISVVKEKNVKLVKQSHLTKSHYEGLLKEKTQVIKDLKVKEGVIHTTSVSRPHLKSTKVKDKVVPKNSQVKLKKIDVEEHPRISNISKKTMSVTTVIHTTSVSRPHLKSTKVKDKVVPKNSQVKLKKIDVEEHHRISNISKKTKSVRTSPLAYDPEVERSARLRRKAVRQFSTNLDFAGSKELFTEMSDDDATGAESPPRDTYHVNNTTKDGARLCLFPFSLKDQAKAWFTSLEPGSIHSWSEMQCAFLDEFYSICKTAAIRNKIKSFHQIPGEKFHEDFSRLKELLRT